MYKRTYYLTVLVVVFGSSFQFYSYDVVNPAQGTVIQWLNSTYQARGLPKTVAQLDLVWSFVVSSIAVGAICGALSTKALAEKLGRRNALIANGILNVTGALLELFAKPLGSPELLILGRIVLGAVMGISSGLAPMYLMEITPMKRRGEVATCHMMVVAFSDWFSLLLGLPEVLGSEQHWPLAFSFPGLPALILCCALPFCPESPKFSLLTRRDRIGTLDALSRLVNVHESQSMFEALQRESISTTAANEEAQHVSVGSIWHLFREKSLRMPVLIAVWVMIAQQFTGCAAVFAYSTDMFLNAGLEPCANPRMDRAPVPIQANRTLQHFGHWHLLLPVRMQLCVLHREKRRKLSRNNKKPKGSVPGRRALSLFQLSTITTSLTLMSVLTWAQAEFQSPIASYASIVALLIYMCGYGIGSPIPWMIASEIFPTKYRASAVTVAISVAWTLAFSVSLAYLPFRRMVGVPASYLPFILVTGLSTAFVYFLLPETKNRHTDEIAEDIQNRSNMLRRHSLQIFPTVNSSMGFRISPSSEAIADARQSMRSRLQSHRSSFAGTSASPGKYSSLGFTPSDERATLWTRVMAERRGPRFY